MGDLRVYEQRIEYGENGKTEKTVTGYREGLPAPGRIIPGKSTWGA
jgi:hypothetical protein